MAGNLASKILLVDDDPITIRVLMTVLQGIGALFVANNGLDALAAAQENPPDIILLDATMPGMDGFDACRALKADPRTADAAIIFVTAHRDIASETRALELGAVDFIHKPINAALVQARVRTHLSVKHQADKLRRFSEELAASNTELQHFAYAVSHDLREPLRTIAAHISLIEECCGNGWDRDSRASMAYVKDAAQRMDKMISDLLDYTRIGHSERTLEDVPIGKLVKIAVENLSVPIVEAGAQIEVDSDFPVVHGHSGDLVRLFQNLIGNAIKYRAPGRCPIVSVKARREGAASAITVADNGIGIDPNDFDRIFGVFQRLHSSETYEGTGIGLALCRKIAASHSGTIRINSTPGQGSSFTVILPLASEARQSWR